LKRMVIAGREDSLTAGTSGPMRYDNGQTRRTLQLTSDSVYGLCTATETTTTAQNWSVKLDERDDGE